MSSNKTKYHLYKARRIIKSLHLTGYRIDTTQRTIFCSDNTIMLMMLVRASKMQYFKLYGHLIRLVDLGFVVQTEIPSISIFQELAKEVDQLTSKLKAL